MVTLRNKGLRPLVLRTQAASFTLPPQTTKGGEVTPGEIQVPIAFWTEAKKNPVVTALLADRTIIALVPKKE